MSDTVECLGKLRKAAHRLFSVLLVVCAVHAHIEHHMIDRAARIERIA